MSVNDRLRTFALRLIWRRESVCGGKPIMAVKWLRIATSFTASLIISSCSLSDFEKASCVTGNYRAKYIASDGSSILFSFTERGRHVELGISSPGGSEDHEPISKDGSLTESGYEISDFVVIPKKWPPIGNWEGNNLKCKSNDSGLYKESKIVNFFCGYVNETRKDEFFYSKDIGITKIIFGALTDRNEGAVVLVSPKGISMPCDQSKSSG